MENTCLLLNKILFSKEAMFRNTIVHWILLILLHWQYHKGRCDDSYILCLTTLSSAFVFPFYVSLTEYVRNNVNQKKLRFHNFLCKDTIKLHNFSNILKMESSVLNQKNKYKKWCLYSLINRMSCVYF